MQNTQCKGSATSSLLVRQKLRLYDIARMLLLCFAVVFSLTCVAFAFPDSPDELEGKSTLLKRDQTGIPFGQNYSMKDHGRGAQNWAVVQDVRGLMYIGNQAGGVLEFDGVRWRFIATDNGNSTPRSLAVDRNNRIYVGGIGEIGFLEADHSGNMYYKSMMNLLPVEERKFADVWKTVVIDDSVYFSSNAKIIRIRGKEVKIWKPKTSFHFSYVVNGQFVTRETGRGILKLVNDELILVQGSEIFANDKIYAVLPWRDESENTSNPPANQWIVGARNAGWFLYDGVGFTPWANEAENELKEALIYDALWLRDGNLAIGTLLGGLYVLDRTGRLIKHLEKAEGLISSDIKAMVQDAQDNLWICTGSGISQIAISSPLSYFDERQGIGAGISALHRHQGQLYVGNTTGLFRLAADGKGKQGFIAVPEASSRAWAMASWGNKLLIGNYNGLFELENGKLTKIPGPPQNVLSLLRSSIDPNRLFVGHIDGVLSLRLVNHVWVSEGALPNLNAQVRSLHETADGTLWIGTEKSGIIRAQFPAINDAVTNKESRNSQAVIKHFSVKDGLPSLNRNITVTIAGDLRFATSTSVYAFDEKTQQFTEDPRFIQLFSSPQSSVLFLEEDLHGQLWMVRNNQTLNQQSIGKAILQKNGEYAWDGSDATPLNAFSMDAMLIEPDGAIWFGGAEGLYQLDPKRKSLNAHQFSSQLRRVTNNGGQIIYNGAGKIADPVIDFDHNAVRFEFSASNYLFANLNRYQVKLLGVDSEWSNWSEESYRDYTNLTEGKYTFLVRALNGFDIQSKENSFQFKILPPWYRQWWAYLAYVLFFTIPFMQYFNYS